MNRIFVLSLILLVSRDFDVEYKNREEDKSSAQEVSNYFYENLKQKNYKNLHKNFSSTFYNEVTPEQLEKGFEPNKMEN